MNEAVKGGKGGSASKATKAGAQRQTGTVGGKGKGGDRGYVRKGEALSADDPRAKRFGRALRRKLEAAGIDPGDFPDDAGFMRFVTSVSKALAGAQGKRQPLEAVMARVAGRLIQGGQASGLMGKGAKPAAPSRPAEPPARMNPPARPAPTEGRAPTFELREPAAPLPPSQVGDIGSRLLLTATGPSRLPEPSRTRSFGLPEQAEFERLNQTVGGPPQAMRPPPAPPVNPSAVPLGDLLDRYTTRTDRAPSPPPSWALPAPVPRGPDRTETIGGVVRGLPSFAGRMAGEAFDAAKAWSDRLTAEEIGRRRAEMRRQAERDGARMQSDFLDRSDPRVR